MSCRNWTVTNSIGCILLPQIAVPFPCNPTGTKRKRRDEASGTTHEPHQYSIGFCQVIPPVLSRSPYPLFFLWSRRRRFCLRLICSFPRTSAFSDFPLSRNWQGLLAARACVRVCVCVTHPDSRLARERTASRSLEIKTGSCHVQWQTTHVN